MGACLDLARCRGIADRVGSHHGSASHLERLPQAKRRSVAAVCGIAGQFGQVFAAFTQRLDGFEGLVDKIGEAHA